MKQIILLLLLQMGSIGFCDISSNRDEKIDQRNPFVLGKGVGQLALFSGADDVSSVVIEENVLRSYGLKSEEEAVGFLRSAGFTPKRRDLLYNYEKYGDKQDVQAKKYVPLGN